MPYTSRHDASLRTKAACAVRGIREDIPNYIRERERERERERDYKIIWYYQIIYVKKIKKIGFSLQHNLPQRVFGVIL